jgi:alpha-L-arabinofuranosidase
MVAALSSDQRTFLLSVVNPTEDAQEFSPQITGVQLRGHGKLWQIAASNLNAANEPGKKPAVQILEYSQQVLSETIPVPPISVNVYEFQIV